MHVIITNELTEHFGDTPVQQNLQLVVGRALFPDDSG